MNWILELIRLLSNAMGMKRKRPTVDVSAQKKVDQAWADKKEAKLENKEADVDWSTQIEQGAREYGISKRQWKRLDRQAKVLGISFADHWKDSKLRKRKTKKFGL